MMEINTGGEHTMTVPAPLLLEKKMQGAYDFSSLDCEQWTSLGKFVNVLAIAELATKVFIYEHLCSFLSSSATTFSYPSPSSSEEISVSAFVRSRRVCITYDDVLDLHDCLFQEVAHHMPSFSTDSDTIMRSYDTFPLTSIEVKVTALALRCCIRVLPLIELFDTGLRNAVGVTLDRFLQKLCSPKEPCLLPGSDCTVHEGTSKAEAYRGPTLCAMLEVYIDELLSRPKTHFLLLQEDSIDKDTRSPARLTLEATLAHVMISARAPTKPHGPRARASELSLQSAVILLDKAITDNMPRYLLSHITSMVSQALEPYACKDSASLIDTDLPKKWFSRYTHSGSRMMNGRSTGLYIGLDSLSWQVRFCLVSSVLERAVSLYMRFASAPHLANFVTTSKDDLPIVISSNALLGSCLWNYVNSRGFMSQKCEAALESMLNDATLRKGLEESIDQTSCSGHIYVPGHDSGQGTKLVTGAGFSNGNIERLSGTHFCGRELCSAPIWEEDHSTLVADILHLMHSALDFVMEKAQMLRQESEDCLPSDMTRDDLDYVLFELIGAFHECLPSTAVTTSSESLGDVLVFFTNMLYYEAETTISDNQLHEYLKLLESLLISLLLEDKWGRKISMSPQLVDQGNGESTSVEVDKCRQEDSGMRTPPGSYAQEVVGLLQGFLEEPDLLEILGGNAVSIILQINSFLNDFCEFMDNVLSSVAWREIVPTDGRHIVKKKSKLLQRGFDVIERDMGEDTFDFENRIWEDERSPEEELKIVADRPSLENTPIEEQQLRPGTLPILQKLMKHRTHPVKPCDPSPDRIPSPEEKEEKREGRPVRKCRQVVVSEVIAEEAMKLLLEPEGNQYVAEVLLLEKTSSKENFDDLQDFIVCKKGRSYTKWLNRRTKFRRRKQTREIWKRSEDKKKLLSMLNIA